MTNSAHENDPAIGKLLNKYDSLEKRISLIEARLSAHGANTIGKPDLAEELEEDFKSPFAAGTDLEVKIGSHGLAWLGNIVLVLGIMFLMTYAQNLGFNVLSSSIGLFLAGTLFLAAHKFRKSLSHLVFMLNFSGYVLSFYVILRLHFFTPEPLVGQMTAGLILMLILIGALLWFAIKRNSELFGTLSVFFLIITALATGSTHITLVLITLGAATSALLFLKKDWKILLMISLFLVYLSHLIWLLGNPVTGNSLGVIDSHQNNIYYLFAYASIYALLVLLPSKESIQEKYYNSLVIWNAVLFLILILMEVLAFYENNYAGIFAVITVICLAYSMLLHSRTKGLFIPAMFACFGFMAMSVSVYGYTGLPNAHLLLALQSLLVVSIALWYRSRIIIIVNTLLYLSILLIYLFAYPSVNSINIVFALVALASARILNWQKERLTLRTDGLRNLYLVEAFIMVLYSLHQAVPDQYVTLSWTLAAAIYLVLSILLHNIKYRWMAIATFISTAVYLFLVDLASLQVGYRVLAFLFLAVISLAASIYYSKRLRNKTES